MSPSVAAGGRSVRELAARHGTLDPQARPTASVRSHHRRLREGLEDARARLEAAAALGVPLAAAPQWLLDNVHVVRESLDRVLEDLPPSYFRRLPAGEEAGGESWPRVRDLARRAVEDSPDGFDPQVLSHLVEVYQEENLLGTGELWALPALLRLLALEELAAAVAGLAAGSPEDGERARRAGRCSDG